MHQPRAIAVEDRQRSVEDIAHHLLEVIRGLHDSIDAIDAFEQPHVPLLFRESRLQLLVAPLEIRRALTNARLELCADLPRRILRPASRRAHGGNPRGAKLMRRVPVIAT
jgi:hypothetical protein